MNTVKTVFDKIGVNYPERSRRVIILNAGWTFSAIWYVVKSFLAQETIDKYIFIDGYYDDIRVRKKIFFFNIKFFKKEKIIRLY